MNTLQQLMTVFLFTISLFNNGCYIKNNEPVEQTNFAKTENLNRTNTQKSQYCSVDFKNFTYSLPSELGKGKFTLKNGELMPTRNSDGHVDEMGYSLSSEYYDDLVGDKMKEAVITLSVTTGGSAQPYIIYVFDLSEKTPKLLWTFVSGDRAEGGLRNVYTDNNKLVIETYEPKGSNGDCCPNSYKSVIFQWRDNTFVEIERKVNLRNLNNNALYIGQNSPCE